MTTFKSKLADPWKDSYRDVPNSLKYPDCSMYEYFLESVKIAPQKNALYFEGKQTTYEKLNEQIILCANAFLALGIKQNDKVLICMPNIPQTVICLYALNRIGAVSALIHPLSSCGEILHSLSLVKCKFAVTLDQFLNKFDEIDYSKYLTKLIVACISDALNPIKGALFSFMNRKKYPKTVSGGNLINWNDFLSGGNGYLKDNFVKPDKNDASVILFSGGTTGTTKAIVLTNLNFNALSVQTKEMGHCVTPNTKVLAVLPMFHGFGLGVCVHTALTHSVQTILVPRFSLKGMIKILKTVKPNIIAGVPTLFENLIKAENMRNIDLSYLTGVFCGGDSLSPELMRRMNTFLNEHNAKVQIREGYGTTECVTVSSLNPYYESREGSIGIPFPDTFYKIVAVGTCDALPFNTDGEICLTGPTVMKEYLDNPEETVNVLKVHHDGEVWLHTGDIGYLGDDGYIYFKQRLKRVIISSGYNIYPSQIEAAIDSCDIVQRSCVIGVKDDFKGHKPKGFVVLKCGIEPNEENKKVIINHIKKHVAKFAMVYDIEFIESLPMTNVAKVAYTVLEERERLKNS